MTLLDLPFEYSRYRKIRPLLFQGLKQMRFFNDCGN